MKCKSENLVMFSYFWSPNAHASTVSCETSWHCLYEIEVVLNFAELQIFSYQKQDKAIWKFPFLDV